MPEERHSYEKMISRRLRKNWKQYPNYHIKNKTRNKLITERISSDLEYKIRQLEIFDVQLYNEATRIFGDLVQQYDLTERLAKFQIRNTQIQKKKNIREFLKYYIKRITNRV